MITVIVLSVALVLSLLVAWTGSYPLAVALPIVGFVWLLSLEIIGVTNFLHRVVSHAVLYIKARWLDMLMLWAARSGGAKVDQWGRTHIRHHPDAGTEYDPYSPNVDMISGRKKIRRPSLFRPWRVDNTLAYYAANDWDEAHPEHMEMLAEKYESVRRGLASLAKYDKDRDFYNRVWRARFIDSAFFALLLLPLAIQYGPLWGTVLEVVGAPALLLLKIDLYLDAGFKVNYWGHRLKTGLPDWTNIPAWLALFTLWLAGEGWHRAHHDLPSSRFHRFGDPGWWIIWVWLKFGWVDQVYVAEPVPVEELPEVMPSNVINLYRLVRYDKVDDDEELVAA